jgi:hypothetical protein
MLDEPDQEPVWVEFTFDAARDAITSGQVLFGIRDSELAGIRRSKLENRLLGFPHETKSAVPCGRGVRLRPVRETTFGVADGIRTRDLVGHSHAL